LMNNERTTVTTLQRKIARVKANNSKRLKSFPWPGSHSCILFWKETNTLNETGS
jgi:hypothetical protein